MSGWGDVKEGSGVYMNLKQDGDKFTGVILGEPFLQIIPQKDNKTRKSYLFNLGLSGEKKAVIFRCGVKLANQFKVVLKCDEKDKPKDSLVGKVSLHVQRHGVAGDRDTTYEVASKKLTPAEVKTFARVELNDLAKEPVPETKY